LREKRHLMRLTNTEIATIKNVISTQDPNAKVYLYGSRVDDNKKGGDIDLLVMSDIIDFDKKVDIMSQLFNALDEQKVDLLISHNKNDPFVKVARRTAQRL